MSDFNPLAKRSLGNSMQDLTDDLLPISDDGTITLGAFTLTPMGLKIKGTPTETDWMTVGGALRRLQSSLQWLIGDWLNHGEIEYGRTYQDIAGVWSYDLDTLYQYKWVAKQVRFSMRIENLSFSHHQIVASCESEELRRYWLQQAYANGWSTAELRRAMKPPRLGRNPSARVLYKRFSTRALPTLAEALEPLTVEQLEVAYKEIEELLQQIWDRKQEGAS